MPHRLPSDTLPHRDPAVAHHDGPVAIVTGGTQGLGYALVKLLLLRGFAVVTCARSEADVTRLASEFAPAAVSSPTTAAQRDPSDPASDPASATVAHAVAAPALQALCGDVTQPSFQQQLIDVAIRCYGRIDAVVNNASTLGMVPLPSISESHSANETTVLAVNVLAPIAIIRRTLPHLRAQHRGLILGISSDAAIGGYPNWGVYGASKAALDLLHKTLAAELAEAAPGVKVYSVDPGDMNTAMHHAAIPGATDLADPAAVAQHLWPLFAALLPATAQAALIQSIPQSPSQAAQQATSLQAVADQWRLCVTPAGLVGGSAL